MALTDRPWREAEFCVVDLETTGLDPGVDEIISFASLPIAEGRLRVGDLRYRVVRPRRMPEAETIRIHGLRSADLADAPTLAEILDELLEALADRVLVAHVAAVERGFLEPALATRGLELTNPTVDTAALGAELMRRRGRKVQDPIGLGPLAEALGLPVHRPHTADGDALTTGQAFLALAGHLDSFEPQTVASLARHELRVDRGSLVRALRSLTRRG